MATPPDFTVGQVLTAAQMNAVGLWKITPTSVTNGTLSNGVVTVGSGVSSVTVNGAFNSDFVNYKIILEGIDCSVLDTTLFIRPGAVATGNPYSSGGYFVLYSGTGTGYLNSSGTNDGIAVGITSTDSMSLAFDILAPNVPRWTRAMGHWTGDLYTGSYGGVMKTTSSYTSFELRPAGGTFTGGTIRIYGYRN